MTERIWVWLAWRLPRGLVYWCAIRLITAAYGGKYADRVMGTLTTGEVIGAWRGEEP